MTRARIALLLAGLLACLPAGAQSCVPLRVGDTVPAYTVRTLGGTKTGLAAPGRLTLVNVWATWCAPCRREFPALDALQRRHGGGRLRVLAISIDAGDDAPVRQFAAEAGPSLLIGRDPGGDVQRVLHTVGVPESFLVDGAGTVLWHRAGGVERALPDVERILAGRSAPHPP
jgi:thiol-disulfide isomerase/thioredoxin